MSNGFTAGWTAAKEQQLRELWPDKSLSCSMIADQIGVTRNSAIGKARRLGLGGKEKPVPKPATPRPRRSYPVRTPEPFKARAALLAPLNLTILHVRDDQCKYMAGDDHLCCGHDVVPGKPYCPSHCRIVYRIIDGRQIKTGQPSREFATNLRKKNIPAVLVCSEESV